MPATMRVQRPHERPHAIRQASPRAEIVARRPSVAGQQLSATVTPCVARCCAITSRPIRTASRIVSSSAVDVAGSASTSTLHVSSTSHRSSYSAVSTRTPIRVPSRNPMPDPQGPRAQGQPPPRAPADNRPHPSTCGQLRSRPRSTLDTDTTSQGPPSRSTRSDTLSSAELRASSATLLWPFRVVAGPVVAQPRSRPPAEPAPGGLGLDGGERRQIIDRADGSRWWSVHGGLRGRGAADDPGGASGPNLAGCTNAGGVRRHDDQLGVSLRGATASILNGCPAGAGAHCVFWSWPRVHHNELTVPSIRPVVVIDVDVASGADVGERLIAQGAEPVVTAAGQLAGD